MKSLLRQLRRPKFPTTLRRVMPMTYTAQRLPYYLRQGCGYYTVTPPKQLVAIRGPSSLNSSSSFSTFTSSSETQKFAVPFTKLEEIYRSTLGATAGDPKGVSTAEIIQKMQSSGQAYRHQPMAGVDYVVTELQKANEHFTKLHLTKAGIESQQHTLVEKCRKLQLELETWEKQKKQLDLKAEKAPAWFGRVGFTLLLAQWCILFRFVFFTFDWNLIEPITYFLGYSTMMIGIFWYNSAKQEYDYNTVHEVIAEKMRRRLYAKAKFDIEKFEALKVEIEALQAQINRLVIEQNGTEKVAKH